MENVHFGSTYPFKLDKTEVDCTGLVMDLTMTGMIGMLPYGTWYIYAKTEGGYWEHIAQFTFTEDMNGKTTRFYLKFDKPETFDYLAVCPGTSQAHSRSQTAVYYYYE